MFAAVLVAVAGTLLTACTHLVSGSAVSVFADPFRVAGMPAVDGPSGLRADAAAPTRTVQGTDGGEIDELAASAVSDVEEFWDTAYSDVFGGQFSTVRGLVSWDAAGFFDVFCAMNTYGMENAGFCYLDETIGWDRGRLFPALRRANGDMAVAMVLAHEYGHWVSRQAGLTDRDTPILVGEQQADCFSGAYMRWVAQGDSPRFTLSTADGLNSVLAAVIAFRDPLFSEGDWLVGFNEHGSAFERLSAFQFGFTNGPSACAGIDLAEIEQRRGNLPVLLPENQTGELPVTERSVRTLLDALDIVFAPQAPPQLSLSASEAQRCPDARPSPPVSYCPATNVIAVELGELAALGTQADTAEGLASGDNTAYSVLTSRYVLALQREHGAVSLNDAKAALRTACLTGVATTRMSTEVVTSDGSSIALTAGDLDEAVSGMLTNGLVASDVHGETVPSGFSRIDAFRLGVLGDAQRCYQRFG
ncbi:neutral zinc metallopeptidase [Mycolicibacterium thermoresistibile]